ncbi:MAG: MBL fold metallo-hydrolase [Verrucomicrobiia bacterium]
MKKMMILGLLLSLGMIHSGAQESERSVQAKLTWLGHGYFIVTTTTGIRVAIDPYDRNLFPYQLPATPEADIVLITHESNEANAAEQVGGNPQVYRSATGLGLNVANGMRFFGTRSQRSNSANNVVFSFRTGDIRIAHLGALGQKLSGDDLESIGPVDIVMAAIGHPLSLLPEEMVETVKALGAKVLVPAFYETPYSKNFRLGSLEEFLKKNPEIPVKELSSNELILSLSKLPKSLQIWVLKTPADAPTLPEKSKDDKTQKKPEAKSETTP